MRHAMLIAAHHQFDILAKTLRILDDPDVDFFIHIDRKCTEHPEDNLASICETSRVRFIERTSVYWGGTAK